MYNYFFCEKANNHRRNNVNATTASIKKPVLESISTSLNGDTAKINYYKICHFVLNFK